MLIVCECIRVVRSLERSSTKFHLHYGDSEMVFEASTEADCDQWLIEASSIILHLQNFYGNVYSLQLSICSHHKVQAELDQLLYELNVENSNCDGDHVRTPESPLSHFFLTAPAKRELTFSVFHVCFQSEHFASILFVIVEL